MRNDYFTSIIFTYLHQCSANTVAGCVGMYYNILLIIKVCKSRGIDQQFFNLFKGFFCGSNQTNGVSAFNKELSGSNIWDLFVIKLPAKLTAPRNCNKESLLPGGGHFAIASTRLGKMLIPSLETRDVQVPEFSGSGGFEKFWRDRVGLPTRSGSRKKSDPE